MLKFDKKEGFFKKFHDNGQLKEEGNSINGKKEGLYKTYYENGQLKSEGNYKDDKLDGLHYYTWFIKTGRGRATEDAAVEVRNKIITREEAVALVKKYDGEFPKKYFKECFF